MDQKYQTTHKGIAGYLVMQGYQILRMIPGTNQKTGRSQVKIEFDVERQAGREMGDAFFDGAVNGNLKEFYDGCAQVSQEIYKAKGRG